MATKDKVGLVVEGATVKLMAGPSHARHLAQFTIGPRCGHDAGRWLCVTHDKVLWNNCEKDGHIEKGRHVLAWFCAHHGPEVP